MESTYVGFMAATPTRPNLAFTLELMNPRECQNSLHDVANLLGYNITL